MADDLLFQLLRFRCSHDAVDAAVVSVEVLHVRQLAGVAAGVGQRPPTEGDFGRKRPQFVVQFGKFRSAKVPEGSLQKRIVSVKIETMENVEKGLKRIGIVAVWETHGRQHFNDGLKKPGLPHFLR